jgi:hypothetical protein
VTAHRTSLFAALTLTTLATVLVVVPDAATAAQPPHRFLLRQASSRHCASISPASPHDAALAVCDETAPDEAFSPVAAGDGTYRLERADGSCLASNAGAPMNGSTLFTAPCADSAEQRWQFGPLGVDGTQTIANAGSQLCVDTSYAAMTTATPVVQGGCTVARSQRWQLIDVTFRYHAKLLQVGSGWCATLASGTAFLAACDGSPDRFFYLGQFFFRGWGRVSVATGLCLTVAPAFTGIANGARVIGAACTDSVYQEWHYPAAGPLSIVVGGRTWCLDTSSSAKTLQTRLVVGICTSSDTQTWANLL